MTDTAGLCDHERLLRGLGVAAGQRDGALLALFERAADNLRTIAGLLRGEVDLREEEWQKVSLFTVTFCANSAHDLTCPPS